MKKNYIFTLLMTLCLTGASFGQEMLLNGGLENWDSDTAPTDWTKAEALTKSTDAYTGSFSAFRNGGSSTKDLSQTVTGVIPGNSYTISFWYKVTAGDDQDARIWCAWSADWTFSGINVFDGETTNATAASSFPIASYMNATASVKNNAIEGFATYPNPVTNKEFTISSRSTSVKEVAIFNLLGKQVLSSSFSGVKSNVDVSTISAGIYILKVTEEGKTATKKLVIK